MGVLSALGELRVRAMANVLDVAGADAGAWKTLLPDLGQVGRDARPVVIQGGLSTDAYLYDPFKRLLQHHGFDVTATHLDLHGYASLQRDAGNLREMVEAASRRSLERGGDGLVNVVAHSKGGLASRWYLQQMDGIEHVAQLITIGTPHNGSAPLGTTLSGLGGKLTAIRGISQIGVASREVRTLNADLPAFMERARAQRPDFRIVSVTGDIDLPGLRGTDGLVSTGAAHLDDSIPGLANLVYRGAGAHHGAVAGQFGMFEPTLRAATELLAGRAVPDAALGAASLTR